MREEQQWKIWKLNIHVLLVHLSLLLHELDKMYVSTFIINFRWKIHLKYFRCRAWWMRWIMRNGEMSAREIHRVIIAVSAHAQNIASSWRDGAFTHPSPFTLCTVFHAMLVGVTSILSHPLLIDDWRHKRSFNSSFSTHFITWWFRKSCCVQLQVGFFYWQRLRITWEEFGDEWW
jgi:hypothetical protein